MSPIDNEKEGNRISKEVVDKIKKSGIKMKPPCYFTAFSFFWFGLGAFFYLVSLVLFAFCIHYLDEYEFFGLISKGYFSGWFFVHFAGIAIAVFLIYLSSRFYRKGRICCRHEEWMLLFSMGIVAFFGLFLLIKNDLFNNWRDKIEEHQIVQDFIVSRQGFWSDLERGKTFGEVIEKNKQGKYILIKNKEGETQKINMENCNCEINYLTVEEGRTIKLIGDFNDGNFQAKGAWY